VTGSLAVLTPSHGPDVELFRDLHASVLRNTPPSVVHHVLVPRRDLKVFSEFSGSRCVLVDEREVLPPGFLRTGTRWTINVRRPYPPIRNWILQQIIKLSAASLLRTDAVLLVDSDVAVVRPFEADDVWSPHGPRTYRKPDAVDGRLPRHVLWHDAARDLLGTGRRATPLADYVSSFMLWKPSVLRDVLQRVEQVTHQPWPTAVGARLHFSEWTLYGVYVDEVLTPPTSAFTTDDRCHNYWDPHPLDATGAVDFAAGIPSSALAMMISAKSRTPLEVRRLALSAADAAVGPRAPSQLPQAVAPAGDVDVQPQPTSRE
jgi:hypothetical protein